jgi:hypothetical protein
MEPQPSSLSSYPAFSAYHNQHDSRPDPMILNITTPLYPDFCNNQHLLNQFIPNIDSSQLAAPYSFEYHLPSHQLSQPIEILTHLNPPPNDSNTATTSHHPYLTMHDHILQNHNSDLGHQEQTEMASEQDADGETDEEEDINESKDYYDFIREEETEGEIPDDESEEDDNEQQDCGFLILTISVTLS